MFSHFNGAGDVGSGGAKDPAGGEKEREELMKVIKMSPL